MKKLLPILLIFILTLCGCGPAIREKKEEIEKMDIPTIYRLAIKYYSEGLVDESEILYKEIINKYSQLKTPSEEEKRTYFWALYEVGFINYTKGIYKTSKEYLEKLFSEVGNNHTLPQVVLGKKIYSKVKSTE
ncbi:MAG: hypothetical protein ABDH28_01735 [Brevinematia bacterium]